MKRLAVVLVALLAGACGAQHSGPPSPSGPPHVAHHRHGRIPVLFGSAAAPTVGEVLTTTNGIWTNSPTSYAYQWQDCTSPTACTNIVGATSSSYTIQNSDLGDTIQVIVTASNASGSASQTSAQTGTVTSGTSCAQTTANIPDGPDPWGGCFPGPTTTGVPSGTTLTAISPNSSGTGWSANANGEVTVTACGVTFNDVKITPTSTSAGTVAFTVADNVNNGFHDASHPCVTLQNSEVDGVVMVSNNAGEGNSGPLVLTNDLVNVPNAEIQNSPILSANYFATGVNVEGGRLGFSCQGNCTVTNSYAHTGYMACSGDGSSTCTSGSAGFHYNAWGSNGLNGPSSLEHDTLSCDFNNLGTSYANLAITDGAGCSDVIGIHSDFDPSNNLTIDKTLLVSTNNGSSNADSPFCLEPNNPENGKYYPYGTNIAVTNNVFQKGGSPQSPSGVCGTFGANGDWTWGDGNSWTGNTYDNGTTLSQTAGPSNSALPAITGTVGNGNTLTVSNGTWTNCGTGCTFAYRWFDCGTGTTANQTTVNCQAINSPEGGGSGVTTSSYTMSSSDTPTYAAGDKIKAVVTATGTGSFGGSTNADAAAVS